jgi:hypothetical protein
MGVHPGPSVVRAKGFLTGDVNQRRDLTTRNGSVLDRWIARVHESAALTGAIDLDEQRNASSEPGEP